MESSPNFKDVAQLMEAAHHLFRLGMFSDAEKAYRDVVQLERGNAEALNLLGIAAQRQGKREEAIDALLTAMDIAPRSPEIVVNLGNIYKEDGDNPKAIRYYRKALSLSPQYIAAHVNLASCLMEIGNLELAEAHALQAVEIDSRSMEAVSTLASVKERRGNYAEAIEILEECTRDFADHPDMLLQLGCAYSLAKRHKSAIAVLGHALHIRPTFVEAIASLSHAYFELGQLEDAEKCLNEGLRLRPEMKELLSNLANILIGQCRNMEALECIEQILEGDPDDASAHFIRGMIYLSMGDFQYGWREYAWRWYTEKFRPKLGVLTVPEWKGELLKNGETLFVHAEQGIGDTIQFVRYLPLINKGEGRVVLEAQPPLKRLLGRLDGLDGLIENGEPPPHFDFHVPLLSIPGVIGTDLSCIPAHVPYLSVDGTAKEVWLRRLETLGPGRRVGIAWAGSPSHANDHNRSMALAQLAPLAEIQGVRWISLQKGLAAEQACDQSLGFDLIDWTGDLYDFADTAALVDCLDLVVAVDTSVVHLAGALNKPVWAMIPFAPDWRWLLDRTDSPWYPSCRLFRQSERGNWEMVVLEVAQALKRLTKADSSAET